MKGSFSALRVNSERLRANFETLAAIGATPDGGVHRPALSDAHLEARRWFLERAEQLGLDARVDSAGNHSAVLRCGKASGPALLVGSHLDSVPYGGRFDGALGVLAALEVLQVVKEQGISLNTHLEAIDFTDEEGRFVSLVGSLALSGQLEPEHLQNPRGGRDRFQKALHHAGLNESSLFSAGRDPATVAGYLELHIEQGMRLIESAMQIGIVTSIVGIRSFRIRFIGRADHAGTMPMDRRLDAAQGACAFTLAARELVMKDFPGRVVNVGNMEFEPGAFNVVPQEVTVALEFRADSDDKLDEMEAALLRQASVEAQRFGLDLETEFLDGTSPARMHERVQGAFADASKTLGLKHTFLSSGAGHDAQALARICPTGMIFVPSVGGFSHSSQEFTEWEDCVNGANVLLHAALLLAQGDPGCNTVKRRRSSSDLV
jgi:N-carbamoyl-L-amino-acid hydrolase